MLEENETEYRYYITFQLKGIRQPYKEFVGDIKARLVNEIIPQYIKDTIKPKEGDYKVTPVEDTLTDGALNLKVIVTSKDKTSVKLEDTLGYLYNKDFYFYTFVKDFKIDPLKGLLKPETLKAFKGMLDEL